MQQSLFVQTSEGLMNLALVRYTMSLEVDGNRTVRFLFSADDTSVDCVDLPEKEAQRIIDVLGAEHPELFLAA
jgi:hypothetical protein